MQNYCKLTYFRDTSGKSFQNMERPFHTISAQEAEQRSTDKREDSSKIASAEKILASIKLVEEDYETSHCSNHFSGVDLVFAM